MNRLLSFGLGLGAFGLFSYSVLSDACSWPGCATLGEMLSTSTRVPNPTLTPGSILDTDPVVICTPGYAKSHRVWRDKHGTAVKYGIPLNVAQSMEDDDLIPVGLGGNNADPKNHWLQPWDEALTKDAQEHQDEALICRVLREQGSIAATKVLHERQQYYLINGWAK